MTEVSVLGAHGRMGQKVVQLLTSEYTNRLTLGSLVNRGDSLDAPLKSDLVIDFSSVAATLTLAQHALKQTKSLPAFIIGTTGLNSEGMTVLGQLAQKTPVFFASNFSLGIYVLGEIIKQQSPLLKKLGYTPTLLEIHHRHKKDTPSGTAITLQRLINPDHPEEVQTQSIRAGEVFGDHEVVFYGPNDHIKLAHYAQDRSLWARGAIEVALWIAKEREANSSLTGLLGMNDYFSSLR